MLDQQVELNQVVEGHFVGGVPEGTVSDLVVSRAEEPGNGWNGPDKGSGEPRFLRLHSPKSYPLPVSAAA